MLNIVLEVGTNVAFVDSATGCGGDGVILGTVGSVPPECPLEEVLYQVGCQNTELDMWHYEIKKVIA